MAIQHEATYYLFVRTDTPGTYAKRFLSSVLVSLRQIMLHNSTSSLWPLRDMMAYIIIDGKLEMVFFQDSNIKDF